MRGYRGQTHHELKWSERSEQEEWSCQNCSFVTIDEDIATDHSRIPLREDQLYIDGKLERLQRLKMSGAYLEVARAKMQYDYKVARKNGTFQLLEAVEELAAYLQAAEDNMNE